MTLTYDDEHIPEGQTLVPKDLQDFLKRLRHKCEKLRFFAVGEYGDQTKRPHYHLLLYGYPHCLHGRTLHSDRRPTCCSPCDTIRDTWGNGQIRLDEFNEATARYVVRYSIKKMTEHRKETEKDGRHPVFARQSRRPGIGLPALAEIASVVLQHKLTDKLGDAPHTLRHGSKIYPVGRYLKNGIREQIGVAKEASPFTLERQKESLQALRKIAWESGVSLTQLVQEEHAPIEDRLKYLQKLNKSKHRTLTEKI